ncbi:YtxH domain-containing protein [Falsiporphyromonas endometrii]|uniref:YtxH domain-containing protein n=1 Tax=Falsiporphyromonas endometrii TaxID=1387297 RepID=A0ABV9K9Q0_9PORP
MANRNGGKFTLGLIIGAAAGAAIAYFMDQEKREHFVEGVSYTAEKMKDGIVEGYYDAKERYIKYKNKLTRSTEDLISKIEDADPDEDIDA